MIDTNIMRDEMENANVWGSEERVSMTDLASILTQVDNECFQVCFNCVKQAIAQTGVVIWLVKFAKPRRTR